MTQQDDLGRRLAFCAIDATTSASLRELKP